jgi:hypothetical protein
METEGLLPCLQEFVTSPYSEPERSSLHNPIPSLRDPSVLSIHLRLDLDSGLFPSAFHTYMVSLLPIHATRSVHLILLDFNILIILGEECIS